LPFLIFPRIIIINLFNILSMKKIIILITLIAFCAIPISAESDNVVYLSFDDGPNHIGTDKILEILEKYDIKATFFIIGDLAEKYPDKVRAINDAGHIIGCHTCTHNYQELYSSAEKFINDLYEWENIVSDILCTELPVKLFRFPGGSKSKMLNNCIRNELISSLNAEGYKIFDWTITNNDALVMKNMKNVEEYIKQTFIQSLTHIEKVPSAPKIILMHDIKKHTADTLEWTIEYLINCGYTFDTLDKLPQSYVY